MDIRSVTATQPRGTQPARETPDGQRYVCFRVMGHIDLRALRAAWRATAQRHAARADGLRAAAVVRADDSFGHSDLRTVPHAEVDAAARKLVCGRALEPLRDGIPAALTVVRLRPAEYLLVVTSRTEPGPLLDDVTAHYARLSGNGTAPGAEAPRPSGNRAGLPFDWGTGTADRAASAAGARAVSPAALVHAAFHALLLRYAGEQGSLTFLDVLTGVPEGERTVVRTQARTAAFSDLSARLPLGLRGAVVQRVPVAASGTREGADADLHLVLESCAPTVRGRLEHDGSDAARDFAATLLRQLRTLLDAALDEPGLALSALPVESADDLRAAVADADALLPADHVTPPVPLLVDRHADTPATAAAPAVDWPDRATGYGELTAQAAALAHALRAAGSGAGGTVAVRMPPGPLRIAALLGVMASGARLLWLGTGAGGDRARAMLTELRPDCMVLAGTGAGDELAEWYGREQRGRLLDAEQAAAAGAKDTVPGGLAPVSPDDPAYVAFTSGSTGRPKGIPQSHGALAQFASWLAAHWELGPGARLAQWVAPDHDPALCEVSAALVAGATLCPVPDAVRANPDKLVPWLAEQRITHLQTVPSFAKELLDVVVSGDWAGRLGAFRHMALMGEALREELVDGWRAALPWTRLTNLYGPTETIAATWHDVTGTATGTVPIGRPIPGRQVLVLDEDDAVAPVGVTGSLVVRSPYVTPGYLGTADRSAFRPVDWAAGDRADAGWYRTGDLACRRQDGTLVFRGREDFQIKLLGNRVELTEIENSLNLLGSVTECAVVPHTGPGGLVGRLTVHVVPRRGADGRPLGGAREWRARLRQYFGSLTLPVTFIEVDGRLPRNAAGKVDRSRLRGTAAPA